MSGRLSKGLMRLNAISGNPIYQQMTYLYNAGDERIALTGGWSAGFQTGNGTISKGTATLDLTAYRVNSTTPGARSYATTNTIDLTNFNTLKMKFNSKTSHYASFVRLAAASNRTDNYYNTAQGYVDFTDATGVMINDSIISLDVSSLNGSYYIAGMVYCSSAISNTEELYINKIWLE